MKITWKTIVLFLIISSAILIRTYKLTEYPHFHADEMAFGYGAYSYLKTGRDELSRPMGAVWESVGDYKLTPVAFATIPFITIGGLNELTTRIPSVLWGLGSIALIYRLVKKYTENNTANITTILMLTSPWHILFSRTSNEAILLLFLTVLSLYTYDKASEGRNQIGYILITTVLVSIATVTYYAAFIYIPLLILVFYLSTAGWKKSKWYVLPVVAAFLTNILFISTQPLGRVNQTSIFSSNTIETQQQQLFSNQSPHVPIIVTKMLYNKPVLTLSQLSQNFFDHFTYRFLFAQGDTVTSRYSLPNMGPFFSWQLPFLIIGASITLFNLRYNNVYIFIWLALALAVVPNSLGTNGPNTQRTLNMLPPVTIVIAIGIYQSYVYLKRYKNLHLVMVGGVIPLIAYGILFFINDLFVQMPRTRPDLRQGFAKEYVQKTNELSIQFKKTYVTDGGLYIAHFFYNQTDPYIAQKLMKDRIYTEAKYIMLPKLENTLFMNKDCPSIGEKDTLYVCRGEYIPDNSKVLAVIKHPNGIPVRTFITFPDVRKDSQ